MIDEQDSREAALVKQAVQGDTGAFARLYAAYVRRIYRWVFSMVGDDLPAEDLTPRTFLKAWERLGGYRERGLPSGARLFRIARNNVIDELRRHGNQISCHFCGALLG